MDKSDAYGGEQYLAVRRRIHEISIMTDICVRKTDETPNALYQSYISGISGREVTIKIADLKEWEKIVRDKDTNAVRIEDWKESQRETHAMREVNQDTEVVPCSSAERSHAMEDASEETEVVPCSSVERSHASQRSQSSHKSVRNLSDTFEALSSRPR